MKEPYGKMAPEQGPCRGASVRTCGLRAATFLLAVLAQSLPQPPAEAQQPESGNLPNEYTVKAVFLYSFGRYVEWPDSAFANPSDPFVIGIVGEDPFGGTIDEIAAKKTIHDRRIVVQRFPSVEQYKPPCHILFVSRSVAADRQTALIEATQGKTVLIVGETSGFAERGAAANFFVDGDRIRFEINADAARRAYLHMDAKLLSLGKPVGTPPARGVN